jgi:hypothetical protein
MTAGTAFSLYLAALDPAFSLPLIKHAPNCLRVCIQMSGNIGQ